MIDYILVDHLRAPKIKTNLEATAVPKHEAKNNWLGYQANAWTALYGFRQGYFYCAFSCIRLLFRRPDLPFADSAMGIFYYHLSQRKGKLHWLEIAGIVNQVVFHVHSIFEFRGLSQQVSAVFAALVGGGALANYFANID
jgi:hypothetical protein